MRESIFKKSVTYMEFCRNFAILKHFCSFDNFLEGLFSIGQHFESTSTLFSDIGLVFIALLKSPNEEKNIWSLWVTHPCRKVTHV